MASNFVREPLNGEECDRLVNTCVTFREKLTIWTLLDTGLRVSEFCNLSRNSIQWQENHMIIWGKGGRYGTRKKRRVVPLTPRSKQLLQLYFATNEKIRFSVRGIQRLVKKVANRAMITKPVTPHILRHSFAVNCVKAGLSTASLRKILGHDRLQTTEIYLNICPTDALGEFFKKINDNRHQQ
jgi:integrase/recombinase XerD